MRSKSFSKVTTGMTMALTCLISAAYIHTANAKVISVNIDNQIMDSRSTGAKGNLQASVRLGSGNDWNGSMVLAPGINNLLISLDDNNPGSHGLLQITFPDGKKYAASLPDINKDNKIDVKLKKNTIIMDKVQSESTQLVNQEKYLLNSSLDNKSYRFRKLSENDNNFWTAECSGKAILTEGSLECTINSQPQLKFTSTKVAGVYYFMWDSGIFTTSLTLDEVIRQSKAGKDHSIHFKIGGVGISGITWGSFKKAVIGQFSGSGINLGAGKGRGVFNYME